MKKTLIVLIIIIIIFAGAGLIVYEKFLKEPVSTTEAETLEENGKNAENQKEVEESLAEKQINIYKGTDRPIAVMIDNVGDALPQAGLNDAYMVYEIIVEGGQTRLMALFKGADLSLMGPVRSSRHYFLDYAMENDSIYVHYGWSPNAQSDISKYGINNINGLVTGSGVFWRSGEKAAPHNAVISTENILKAAKKYGYETKSEAESVLNYVADEVTLEEGQDAETITIPYSTSYAVTYKYDEKTKRYKRSTKKSVQKDWKTGEEITTKNIIITFAKNSNLNDGSSKGRQDLENVGTLDGYYITNGKAIKIKCDKKSRKDKTIYKDLDGNEIEVNDGNTFVQICPIKADVKIK